MKVKKAMVVLAAGHLQVLDLQHVVGEQRAQQTDWKEKIFLL